MSEPSSGAHFYLSRTDAASWRSAAKFFSDRVCQKPMNESEIDGKAELLKKQNADHLKDSGAYGRLALEAPPDADSRFFSRLRSGVRIYADIKEVCEAEEKEPEGIPLIPAVPKEKPKPEPGTAMVEEIEPEPKPEPKPKPKPEPKPEPAPRPKPKPASKPAPKPKPEQKERILP